MADRRIITVVTLMVTFAMALILAGCGFERTISEDSQAVVAEHCLTQDCGSVPADWVSYTCPAGVGLTPRSVFLSTNPTDSAASRRAEAVRMNGLLRELAAPAQQISIAGPLAEGGYGTLQQVSTTAAPQVWSAPMPPPAPSDQKKAERERIVKKITDAAEAACRRAAEIARANATSTLDQVASELASGTSVGAVTDVPLERVLALANEHFRINASETNEGILSGVSLTTPMPAVGLFPRLAGSRWIWIYSSTGSAGNDRRLRDIATAYMTANGVTSIEFIDAAYASPAAILSLLRPAGGAGTIPTTPTP